MKSTESPEYGAVVVGASLAGCATATRQQKPGRLVAGVLPRAIAVNAGHALGR
jgi:hypothetical protein